MCTGDRNSFGNDKTFNGTVARGLYVVCVGKTRNKITHTDNSDDTATNNKTPLRPNRRRNTCAVIIVLRKDETKELGFSLSRKCLLYYINIRGGGWGKSEYPVSR